MRANELKRTLRRERVRSLRMQRMIQPQDALNYAVSADLAVNAEGGVEEILTRPDRLDFEDIIASLEMDHGTDVEWELQGNAEGQSAPEGLLSLLSVTVKRLLAHKPKTRPSRGHPQRLARHPRGIGRPDSPSTQELQRMFAGGEHSSTWNPCWCRLKSWPAGSRSRRRRHRRVGADVPPPPQRISALRRTDPRNVGRSRRSGAGRQFGSAAW